MRVENVLRFCVILLRFGGICGTRMDCKRLPKRVMCEEVNGGKGYSGGQEQDWMGCLERDLSLFNLPTEAQHCTLAAEKPGEWFRRVEGAAEQCMKRWFVSVYGEGASNKTTSV